MADQGHPVRRMDDNHVGFELFDLLAAIVVGPAQDFPSAARARNVLRRIFAVDQVRGMGSDKAADDRSFASHAGRLRFGFAAAPPLVARRLRAAASLLPRGLILEPPPPHGTGSQLYRRRRNLGSVTSGATSSNVTSTGRPRAKSSGLTSVTHETIRTPSSSSITAGAYGTSGANWCTKGCAATVHENTVPLPDARAHSKSNDPHFAHMSRGTWRQAAQ